MSHVLILRPAAQAEALQQLLEQRAAHYALPLRCESASMLEIRGYDDPSHSLAQLLATSWDGAMMVSVNAAQYFAEQAAAWAPDQAMPRCRWYAVGPTSARAIARAALERNAIR